MTHLQKEVLEKKRNERRKRSTTSTNRNDFLYGNYDMMTVSMAHVCMQFDDGKDKVVEASLGTFSLVPFFFFDRLFRVAV